MIEIKCVIQGISPLLMNRFTDEAAMEATKGSRGSSKAKKKLSPLEDARSRLYLSEETKRPIIPGPCIFASIREAGKYFKIGRSQITTRDSSMVPGCLIIREIGCEILQKGAEKNGGAKWHVDTRPVRILSTGGGVNRHRPIFHEWGAEFHMILDDEIMDVDLLRELVDTAGKRLGLLDFRPQRKGPYGRFVVIHWEVVTEV
jgi:hypothetical protein